MELEYNYQNKIYEESLKNIKASLFDMINEANQNGDWNSQEIQQLMKFSNEITDVIEQLDRRLSHSEKEMSISPSNSAPENNLEKTEAIVNFPKNEQKEDKTEEKDSNVSLPFQDVNSFVENVNAGKGQAPEGELPQGEKEVKEAESLPPSSDNNDVKIETPETSSPTPEDASQSVLGDVPKEEKQEINSEPPATGTESLPPSVEKIKKVDVHLPKAILVTKVQNEKLLQSRSNQKQELEKINQRANAVIASVSTTASGQTAPANTSQMEAMLEQANRLYQEGKKEEAEQMYQKISEMNKENPQSIQSIMKAA